jgi:hypothetical protein
MYKLSSFFLIAFFLLNSKVTAGPFTAGWGGRPNPEARDRPAPGHSGGGFWDSSIVPKIDKEHSPRVEFLQTQKDAAEIRFYHPELLGCVNQ